MILKCNGGLEMPLESYPSRWKQHFFSIRHSFWWFVFNSAQRCVLPFSFRWIHYCQSSKSTGKETGKMHLCVVVETNTQKKFKIVTPYLTIGFAKELFPFKTWHCNCNGVDITANIYSVICCPLIRISGMLEFSIAFSTTVS